MGKTPEPFGLLRSPTAILDAQHGRRIRIFDLHPAFASTASIGESVALTRCLSIPFCRPARKLPRHHRPGVPRTASPIESAREAFLVLLCAFQGDGCGNPHHSIRAGRRHIERLADHGHGNAACRNPTCGPPEPKPLPRPR
jgi:hypothetical protein